MNYLKDVKLYYKNKNGIISYGFKSDKYITPAIYVDIFPGLSLDYYDNDLMLIETSDGLSFLTDKTNVKKYLAKTPGKQGIKFEPINNIFFDINKFDTKFCKHHSGLLYQTDKGTYIAIYKSKGTIKSYNLATQCIDKLGYDYITNNEDYMFTSLTTSDNKSVINYHGAILFAPVYKGIKYINNDTFAVLLYDDEEFNNRTNHCIDKDGFILY